MDPLINISDYNFNQLCRICLNENPLLQNIFAMSTDLNDSIINAIISCTSVHIKKNDGLPASICEPCHTQLIIAYRFHTLAVKSEKILESYLLLKQTQLICSSVKSEYPEENENFYQNEIENSSNIKQESLSENEISSDLNDCTFKYEEHDIKYLCRGAVDVKLETKTKVKSNKNLEQMKNDLNEIKSKKNKKVQCDICNKFYNRTSLYAHKRIHSGVRPFDCQICNKNFYTSGQLTVHERKHCNKFNSADKKYQCKFCPAYFTSLQLLGKHKSQHEELKSQQYEIFNETIVTSDESSFNKRIFSDDSTYKCKVCDKKFLTVKNLNRHTRIHEMKNIQNKCDICGKLFAWSSNLNLHKRRHFGEKTHQCDVCGKSFIRASDLRIHNLKHTGEKNYKCDICNKFFSQLSTLNLHKRRHTGDRPYQCEICKKSFLRSHDLLIHKRRHSGEKPYICNVCGKRFVDGPNYSKHKLLHTGEKRYCCEICSKCFAHPSSLKTHKRIHSGEKPYQCDVCGKNFAIASYFNIHKEQHTNEKPYKCLICKKCFTQPSSLNTHKRTHDNEK